MCFGNNQPAPPTIIYQGPSQEDIDQQFEDLEKFAADIREDDKIFNEGIQQQIRHQSCDSCFFNYTPPAIPALSHTHA